MSAIVNAFSWAMLQMCTLDASEPYTLRTLLTRGRAPIAGTSRLMKLGEFAKDRETKDLNQKLGEYAKDGETKDLNQLLQQFKLERDSEVSTQCFLAPFPHWESVSQDIFRAYASLVAMRMCVSNYA